MKTYFNWSSGKDSALALHQLLSEGNWNIQSLLTSINSSFNRVSMHGVRRELLERQAQMIGLPLRTLELPENPDMKTYENTLEKGVSELTSEGFTHAGFGDIFLADLKEYRTKQLKPFGIETVFPLWERNTRELLLSFIDQGFKAKIVCVNESQLDSQFVGRDLDRSFLNELPSDVDPCGENGEYHTFCYAGPIFKEAIEIQMGEIVRKTYPDPTESGKETGFQFCDLTLRV